MRRTLSSLAGISGMAVYTPPCRVALQDWCAWTGNDWKKVSSVVGESFRITTHNENAYTMAASAVLRLVLNYEIDPARVGFLGLGTESSTDNSAGSIIVRGMVDKALRELGLPRLSRHCEVPEFKHACLGGVYALKSALRYAELDGGDERVAIVVASDVAEYALGSTGEQTQGAGSVAMLVEKTPRLVELNTKCSGSASDYRGPDFRKPFKRHFIKEYGSTTEHGKIPDFPVFSGPYSTMVYLDEVTMAVENMLAKLKQNPGEYYNSVSALFFHRPYNMMPIQAMSFLYARGLARATSEAHKKYFEELCTTAKVDPTVVQKELDVIPDYFGMIESGSEPKDVFAATNKVAKAVRADKDFITLLRTKMSLGSPAMANFGNLYTASLPCWIAAGFEEAYNKKIDLTGHPMVMVGYGSGDASEAIPMVPVSGWEKAASKVNVAAALEDPVNLTQEQYEGLHKGSLKDDLAADKRHKEFIVGHVGSRNEAAFQDIGIEYYQFVK
ncbi:hydroxymethylglutaryl-CoA synthase [Trypanosoma theileri]|uniref:Hydroxymethylglutaryl-CoA synthase n=1 Tax=Trypanosoma theileri TaxID=67003 RepID=A0A1X0NXJ5_9TRYP|nr:hydroxymethylglutaryl-CoA synthase [Trypanosoma theileri]ORC88860.1 hydroxymethylglutaryl-CoA synthase [Trypanosoma theileri]